MNQKKACRIFSDKDICKLQKDEDRRHLETEMFNILRLSEDGTIHWVGTVTDLIESLHILYLSNRVIDDNGCPTTFIELVRQACNLLHVVVPRNPSSLASRALCRKGFHQRPLLERYSRMLHVSDIHNPLSCLFIRKTPQP